MKKSKILAVGLLTVAALSLFTGCNNVSYKDGVYEGKSSVHDSEDGGGAGYGVVTITISGGEITDCVYLTYEPDGTLKDENYGKQDGEVANADFYNKAQRAVMASTKYGEQLKATKNVKEVDAITGATISYNEFEEAVADALEQAKE